MSESSKAVFLSYASQDKEVAKRICEALRQAGVEVWFDQSELRGGDAWDQMIRKRIKECALFVPVITPTTNTRAEGYFRLEWKLAVDRSHLMADDAPFLFPIVVGEVDDVSARVPDKFREVQWTRLRLDETPAELAGRVSRLLSGSPTYNPEPLTSNRAERTRPRATRWQWWMIFPVAGSIMGLLFAAIPVWKAMNRPPRTASTANVEPGAPHPAPSAPQSEARQLAERVRDMTYKKYDSVAADYATAEGLIQKAIALDPNDADVWAIASLFHTSIRTRGFDTAPGRREQARAEADRATKLAPDSVHALFALGRAQRDSDRVAAEATFKRILTLDPKHAEAVSQLAWLYEGSDRPDDAAVLYDRVLELDPESAPLTHYVRYLMFFHYGRFAEAEAAINQSVALKPSANSVTGQAMVALTWRGDVEGAARALAAAPAALREETRVIWVSALVHLARHDPEEVLRVLARTDSSYIQDNWFAGPKALLAGLAHRQAGRHEAARVAWESALAVVDARLKEAPANAFLHMARGQLLAWLDRPEEARREARTLDELRGDGYAASWFQSSVLIYAALGDADAAIPRLERMLAWKQGTNTGWPLTVALLRTDVRWDPLRGDPRFAKLIARDDAKVIAPASPGDKSVAVLAFANLSDDKANEYFSDGISEELLNVLAKVPGLKVSARTSAFFFKGKEVPIPEIARQLGVAYVVEGSVRKAGDKVRITAQLIKAADGFHVWSETFTRDLQDIFAVQDEIAGLIAQNLSLKLGARSPRAATAVSPQAFELYVQARQAWSLRTTEGFARAEQLLNRALEVAPDFVRARAALIDVVQMRSLRESRIGSFGQRNFQELDRLLEQVRGVLALEPDLAEAHATLGTTLLAKWNLAESERAYRRATELNPNYATGRHWFGMYLAQAGRMDEALAELKLASELDPLSFIILDNYGWLLNLAGRHTEALRMLDRAFALNPGFDQTNRAKASALAALGRDAEAAALARQTKSRDREMDIYLLGVVGLKADAESLRAGMDPGSITNRFRTLLAVGRREEALAALDDLSGVAYGDCIDLLFQPFFDPVRNDPRFIKSLATLGLAEADVRAQAWRKAHPPERK